jgi:hypothetical protein
LAALGQGQAWASLRHVRCGDRGDAEKDEVNYREAATTQPAPVPHLFQDDRRITPRCDRLA